jgi:hypothetical protein
MPHRCPEFEPRVCSDYPVGFKHQYSMDASKIEGALAGDLASTLLLPLQRHSNNKNRTAGTSGKSGPGRITLAIGQQSSSLSAPVSLWWVRAML